MSKILSGRRIDSPFLLLQARPPLEAVTSVQETYLTACEEPEWLLCEGEALHSLRRMWRIILAPLETEDDAAAAGANKHGAVGGALRL